MLNRQSGACRQSFGPYYSFSITSVENPMFRSITACIVFCGTCCASWTAVAQSSCPDPQKCNAYCSVSHVEFWRQGTAGFEADMRICEERCLKKAGACAASNADDGQEEAENRAKSRKGTPPQTMERP